MKKIVIAVFVLVLGYWIVSPYLTLMSLQADIEARDGESLAEKVDFPSVRASLKDQMNVMLTKQMASASNDDPWGAAGAAIGAAFASTLVNGMVDGLVTPAGLIELMSSGETPQSNSGSQNTDEDLAISDADLRYQSINKFSATFEGDSGDEMKVILRRDGFGWKITDIRMPLDN